MYKIFLLICFVVVFLGCENEDKKLDWLSMDSDSAFVQIEKQFRGFDVAMKEVGYRYNELYFAGKDENWSYAQYHLEKIKTAIEYGLERRPKRSLSAKGFLENSIPTMLRTIASKDREVFLKEYEILRQACIGCHIQEKVEFIKVAIPEYRLSPIKMTSKIFE